MAAVDLQEAGGQESTKDQQTTAAADQPQPEVGGFALCPPSWGEEAASERGTDHPNHRLRS
eukprot:5984182-Prorocentrum_lima.AAC.1